MNGYTHLCYTHIGTDSYSPPFLYSFQCSSKIIINYVPVYVLMFLIATVIPFMKVTSKLVYQALVGRKDDKGKWICDLLALFLPEYFRDFQQEGSRVTSTRSSEDRSSLKEGAKRRKKKRLFSKLTITVQINSYLTILMCFGALFPPLALIAATRGLGPGYEWYEEQIERECEGVEESSNLTIWSTLMVSCCLYGYMIFDTMGDSTGGEGALPMTLMMLLMPVLCYGGLRLYRRCKKSESTGTVVGSQGKGKVEGKEDIEGGEEMMVEESSVSFKRVAVGSGREGAPVDIELSTKELLSPLPNTDYSRDLSMVNNPIRQMK